MSQFLQLLIIHCTATPENREVTGDDIRLWHLSPVSKGGRGWKQVGYTDLIKLNGTIERLVSNNEDSIVDNWEITNGVTGKNTIARHIVYAGGTDKNKKPKDTRTTLQHETLKKYVFDFICRFENVKIAGHNQFTDQKACPSFNVAHWLREIGVAEKNIYKGFALPSVNPTATTASKTTSAGSSNSSGKPEETSSNDKILPLIGLLIAVMASYFYIR